MAAGRIPVTGNGLGRECSAHRISCRRWCLEEAVAAGAACGRRRLEAPGPVILASQAFRVSVFGVLCPSRGLCLRETIALAFYRGGCVSAPFAYFSSPMCPQMLPHSPNAGGNFCLSRGHAMHSHPPDIGISGPSEMASVLLVRIRGLSEPIYKGAGDIHSLDSVPGNGPGLRAATRLALETRRASATWALLSAALPSELCSSHPHSRGQESSEWRGSGSPGSLLLAPC